MILAANQAAFFAPASPIATVATVAIGEAGAKNAAWLAARIIGLNDEGVESRHSAKRAALAAG